MTQILPFLCHILVTKTKHHKHLNKDPPKKKPQYNHLSLVTKPLISVLCQRHKNLSSQVGCKAECALNKRSYITGIIPSVKYTLKIGTYQCISCAHLCDMGGAYPHRLGYNTQTPQKDLDGNHFSFSTSIKQCWPN